MLTPEQIEKKKRHITGTDIARILNLSPYGGPLTVWGEKRGLLDAVEPSAAMERGTYLERGLLDWYAAKTGAQLTTPGTVEHPKHSLIAATPDSLASFITREATRAVEAKAPTPWTQRQWGEDGTDDIPEHYIPQAIFEAAVLGVEQTDVIADIGTALRIYPVKYDEELFQTFREAAEKFWHDHVEANIPPPAGPADMGTLKRLYPTARVEDYVEADGELKRQIVIYQMEKQAYEQAKDCLEARKAALIQAIGDNSGIIGEFGRIDFRNNKPSKVVDWKALAQDLLSKIVAANSTMDNWIAKYTTEKPGARPFKFYPKKESK